MEMEDTLLRCAGMGDAATCAGLLENGVDVNCRDKKGSSVTAL